MDMNSQSRAIVLLTASLGKPSGSLAKPLTLKEWTRFRAWLKHNDLKPLDLMKGDVQDLLAGLNDRSVTVDRVESLLNRGGAFGLALERWERAGLWVITLADREYPERLKQQLGTQSPPVLFGCGSKTLLEHEKGIAVVGSRDAEQPDLTFTERLGKQAATQGYTIVSGGARGVDRFAMFGALKNEGRVVGVVADSLLRSATHMQYREFILNGDLALVSPNSPESRFSVGSAMARNRYIYCLADAAIIICSSAGRGGTWNGALEGIKARWVPVWLKRSPHTASGNSELSSRGGQWLPDPLESLDSLLIGSNAFYDSEKSSVTLRLFEEEESHPAKDMQAQALSTQSKTPDYKLASTKERLHPVMDRQTKTEIPSNIDFYDLFLARCSEITSATPLTSDEISERLEVAKGQVHTWLRRGLADNAIKKLRDPTRYQSKLIEEFQASLPSCTSP